ncbi:MAG: preprotein translocase subunit SecY [Promicromonosporaceae bacterium]|nr:preprotein translocase subunit SecY [Promicromonosporaceae bacterium]
MLTAFARAFRTPDLRRKLLFTLAVMALFRLGSYVPAPGVSYPNVRQCLALMQGDTGLLGLVNVFSGGALLQLSIFALGIMPYITASIIIQLLRVVIPHFESLYKEGQAGQAKLTQYTRYLTIGLAIIQSTTVITTARAGFLFPFCPFPILADNSIITTLIMIITMTAGTGLIMWLGELITERGIGNGMSLLIFTSIVSGFPSGLISVWNDFHGIRNFFIILAMIILIVGAVVFVEQSQRRVPVQYAKRMVGRKMYGGTSTYIPIKINMAGVIPVIFASSILAIPTLAAQFGNQESSWVQWVTRNLASQSAPLYIIVYLLLILFFTFFYTSITFDPDEVSDNMKKYGGFVPGIRAGRPTAEYLDYVTTRITSAGAVYLVLLALIPTLIVVILGVSANLPFGGTSILIMVGVGLETVKQIDSQLQQRHYEGFLK